MGARFEPINCDKLIVVLAEKFGFHIEYFMEKTPTELIWISKFMDPDWHSETEKKSRVDNAFEKFKRL